MSLSFNGSSSNLALSTTTFVTAFPFSIFCWVKPNSTTLTVSGMVAGVGDLGGDNELQIHADGTVAGDKLKAFSRNTVSVAAVSTDGMVADTWIPVLAVFTSSTSRTIYAGAGAAVTETTANLTTPFSFDRVVVGKRAKDDTLYFNGLIAHVAAWTAALSQANFDSLAGGAVPDTVASGSLIEYWSLQTQAATQTGVNGLVLTATSTTQGGDDPLAATATTLSGPSSGTVSVASSNFTVGANGTITGTVTVTPSDAADGGTFTPTSVAISSGTPTATFTYTPASTGVKTISISDDGGLTDATPLSYTSNAAASGYAPALFTMRSPSGVNFFGAHR